MGGTVGVALTCSERVYSHPFHFIEETQCAWIAGWCWKLILWTSHRSGGLSLESSRVRIQTELERQAILYWGTRSPLQRSLPKAMHPTLTCLFSAAGKTGEPIQTAICLLHSPLLPLWQIEICCAANGATKREIGRATKFIVKQLEEEMGITMDMGTIHAADLLRRFCSHLGMNNQATRAAIETVKSIEALDIRKSPISVAAAAIYMVSQISDAKLSLKAISDVAGVAEVTIRNSYKELFPHARKLLPNWFAQEQQLKNLSSF